MKHSFINRILLASFALSFVVMASNAEAALNAYLKLKGANGKSYTCTPDANGKFSFKDVAPGKYELQIVGSPEYFMDKEKGHKDELELESFSWGVANGKSKPLSVTKSPTAGTDDGAAAGSDLSGGGLTEPTAKAKALRDKIRSLRVSIENPTSNGDEMYKVVLEDIVISSVSSPSGTIQGMAISTKGAPAIKSKK